MPDEMMRCSYTHWDYFGGVGVQCEATTPRATPAKGWTVQKFSQLCHLHTVVTRRGRAA